MFYLTAIFHHCIVFIIKTFPIDFQWSVMVPLSRKLIKLFVFLAGCLLVAGPSGFAQPVRQAVYAGQFYPKTADELTSLIRGYTERAPKTPLTVPAGSRLKALILPHAGYIYSGWTAAHAARVIGNQSFQKIIIMGPDHRVGFTGCAVSDVSAYTTPLGQVPLHPDAATLRQHHGDLFKSITQSDALEHSIEVELPFLQYFLRNFSFIPIVMGAGDTKQYTDAISEIVDSQTLIVVSSDLSHYLPYEQASAVDGETLRHILDRNAEFLSKHPDRACGTIPLSVLTRLALERDWTPILLHYSNSGDTAGPRDRVVGYAAIAYFENTLPSPQSLKGNDVMEKEHGDILLKLARKTIAERLRLPFPDGESLSPALENQAFSVPRGTFVTLTKNHQLRGCIGNLTADRPLREGVQENASHAAFDDPRFPPLSKDEFKDIVIEISLLTEPQKLEFTDSEDLLNKLRPGVDGVILRKGPYSATFLPQVWDQLPDKTAFLSHLCAKAGLSADEWRRPGLEVRTYQVQYFEEESP